MEKVLAVTFDLGNTLFLRRTADEESRIGEARRRGMLDVLQGYGFTLPLQAVTKGYDECLLLFRTAWEKNLEVSTREQVRHTLMEALGPARAKILDVPQVMKELVEAYERPVIETPPSLNRDARQVLDEMRRRSMLLGVISNTSRASGRVRHLFLEKAGLADYFSAEVYSDEVGWRKPDPRIFAAATAQLETPPPNTLHIGDDLTEDVQGAKQNNMQTLHYNNPHQPARRENVYANPATPPGPHAAASATGSPGAVSSTAPDGTINNLREALDYLAGQQ